MSVAVQVMDSELKLKKARIKLMRHPETCLYSGVMLMGETSVEENVPTAYTDGLNKRYGRKFLESLSVEETAGVDLHETLHVLLKHIPRHRDLMKADRKLANIAMDYVVNDIIMNIEDKSLCNLPRGCFYDPMFHGWSVRKVYDYLKQEQGQSGGSGRKKAESGQLLDDHGDELVENKEPHEINEMNAEIDEALQQGAIIAGKFGAKIPRVIQEIMAPEVDWREVLQDFWTAAVRGADELTWRRLNKRRLADDYYLPSNISETVGEVILAIDTSGSISHDQIGKVVTQIASLCEVCTPDRVRVLWWDTGVHGEQVFEGNYDGLRQALKPMGGGGTRASCVSEYIVSKNLNADCVIVFTDGYVESQVKWDVRCPTLWLIARADNTRFAPPAGQKVIVG